jgi:DNA-binding response OmpR family regulator
MRTLDPATEYCLPTLIVDRNSPAAQLLAKQLRHFGFEADAVSTHSAAQTAARIKHYGSMVVVANLRLAADFDDIAVPRNICPDTWIIVISSAAYAHAEQVVFRRAVDSFLVAPFSVEELTARLLAFARRSRPLLPNSPRFIATQRALRGHAMGTHALVTY